MSPKLAKMILTAIAEDESLETAVKKLFEVGHDLLNVRDVIDEFMEEIFVPAKMFDKHAQPMSFFHQISHLAEEGLVHCIRI
ncbi:MAG: hypothetical protein QW835_00080 [Candidatus Hadarchaeum sp.]